MDNSSLNCTPQQIKHIIKKLPSNKAPGPDTITTTALKKLPIKPIVQIYYIFKVCLKLSYFLTAWKTAKVIPIPKQEKPPTAVESLLSTISKLFEKIIITHLLTHVNNSNIIIHQQFGFRKNHSCIQQLQRVVEHITLEINKNRVTQLILLDLKKAFDSVWHSVP